MQKIEFQAKAQIYKWILLRIKKYELAATFENKGNYLKIKMVVDKSIKGEKNTVYNKGAYSLFVLNKN